MGFYQWFDKQSKAVKIILLIPFWGWVFSFLYRLDKFIEHKDVASLIGFILALVIGFIVSIVDIITVLIDGNIKFLVYGGENFGINGTVDAASSNDENSKDDAVDAEVKEVNEEKKEQE